MLLYLLLSISIWALVQGEDCPYKECYCGGDYIFCNYRYMTAMPQLLLKKNTFMKNLNLDGNTITTIPARSLPNNLTSITLQENPIETIDDAAFDGSINTLQSLKFSGARFTQLPEAVLRLNTLSSLGIYETNILTWNEEAMMKFASTMVSFDLDRVGSTTWPHFIKSFIHLTELGISGCFFSTIPDDALDMVANNLTSLDLYNNSLTTVPKTISKFTVLKSLALQQNRITDITSLPRYSILSTLTLNDNKISDANNLSAVLRIYADTLFSFNIQDNSLTSIPELPFLTQITSLDYTNNQISDLNSGSVPSGLTELKLGNNFLSAIPRIMKNLKISKLELNSNQIRMIQGTEFPQSVTAVDLGYNLITQLSLKCFPDNSSITLLLLNNNPLSDISLDAFNNIPLLQELNLQHSKLTRLPLAISSLTNLYSIDVTGSLYLVCTCMEKSLEARIKPMMPDNVEGDCGHTSLYTFFTLLSPQCPPITRDVNFQI